MMLIGRTESIWFSSIFVKIKSIKAADLDVTPVGCLINCFN